MKNRLYMLVAPSGAGKSTLASNFLSGCPDCIYLNADMLRGCIGKDDSDQSVNHQVFATLKNMLEYFLRLKKSVLLDNTNLSVRARSDWIKIAKKYNYEVQALILNTPIEICLDRNRTRTRVVPDWVITNQFSKFVKPTLEEGFDEIIYWGLKIKIYAENA